LLGGRSNLDLETKGRLEVKRSPARTEIERKASEVAEFVF